MLRTQVCTSMYLCANGTNGCSEDERSIANKLAREEKREKESEEEKDFETVQQKKDPTLPVCAVGGSMVLTTC